MAKKKIEFMETSFRDGFQSVFGARVATKDFLHALEAALDAGIPVSYTDLTLPTIVLV